jgi:C-terminal processing protease CtpA/Prc
LVLGLAGALFAGEDKKCTHETQACLDYMIEHYSTRGFMGIELDGAADALTVKKVYPDTPADKAGLREGDVVRTINGVKPGEDEAAMSAVWADALPGKTWTLSVDRSGKSKDVKIVLGKMPDDMVARMIGQHMLEHATVDMAQSD